MEEVSLLPSLTVAQLRHIGEAALRGNHYEDAIRAFDQALGKAKSEDSETSRLASLALLDLRVEARLRRNNYDRALKDAETMIRLDRTDARAYIRIGQIKRLQGHRAAALKTYSTGLEHVPTNSPLRHVLKIKHKNTLLAIIQSTQIDPVTILPTELLQMILAYFDYREATAIIRVSQNWRDAIVSFPLIHTTLDFSSRSRAISGMAFKACVRRLSRPPSVVIAEELSGPATRELKKHLALWVGLSHLELRNINIEIALVNWSEHLKVLVVGEQQRLNQSHVCRILEVCSSLRRASFSAVKWKANEDAGNGWNKDETLRMPQLRSLTLSGLEIGANAPGRLAWPTSFFNRCPDLQDVCLSDLDLRPRTHQPVLDFSTLSRLRSLTMHRVKLDDFPALPPSLEILNCRAWPSCAGLWPLLVQPPVTDQQHQAPQSYLTGLRTVQFVEMGQQILSPLKHLPPVGEPNTLTQLDLYECQIELADFMRLLERDQLRELKSLRICFPDLDDNHLDTFLLHCPNLETLVLTNTRITGVFVKGMITAPASQLKRLVLGGLDSRVSFDAVEWAQKKGVDVHWNGHRYHSFGVDVVSVVQR